MKTPTLCARSPIAWIIAARTFKFSRGFSSPLSTRGSLWCISIPLEHLFISTCFVDFPPLWSWLWLWLWLWHVPMRAWLCGIEQPLKTMAKLKYNAQIKICVWQVQLGIQGINVDSFGLNNWLKFSFTVFMMLTGPLFQLKPQLECTVLLSGLNISSRALKSTE